MKTWGEGEGDAAGEREGEGEEKRAEKGREARVVWAERGRSLLLQ
jgi:hypothetical protein